MKEIVFFELKKLMDLRKTIILGVILVILCIGSFFIINFMGDAKSAGELLSFYSGPVDDNPRLDAATTRYEEIYHQYIKNGVAMDEATQEEWYDLEYPMWLINCDEVRKSILKDIGFEAETLVIGDTVAYGFFEEFIANYLPFILGFVIALLIAPVFALEYGNKMDGLVLSTKHGKKNVIIGKFIAANLVILAVYSFLVGVFGTISVAVWGVSDGNASFVFAADNVYIYSSSPYNFRVLQYMMILIGCSLLGCLGFGCLTLFVSSRCKNALSASMVSLALVYVPLLTFKMLGENEGIVPNILRLFHGAVMGVRTLFSNYFPVVIGNVTLTIPTISIGIVCVSSVFFSIFAFRGFKKHQAEN